MSTRYTILNTYILCFLNISYTTAYIALKDITFMNYIIHCTLQGDFFCKRYLICIQTIILNRLWQIRLIQTRNFNSKLVLDNISVMLKICIHERQREQFIFIPNNFILKLKPTRRNNGAGSKCRRCHLANICLPSFIGSRKN